MLFFTRRIFLAVFILGFACLPMFGQFLPSQERLRINDYSLFLDDERIVLRGTSEYAYISDPVYYNWLYPYNFCILVDGNGARQSNFLRIWMEGSSNTSGAWKSGDDPHPLFGTSSYPDYAMREQQPFKCTNYLNVQDPADYVYELDSWPDYSFDYEGMEIPKYTDRLNFIVTEARDNNVIVMLTLFDACLKDGDLFRYSAWHPHRNGNATLGYLPESGSPYPGSITSGEGQCFYNIWEWQQDVFGTYIEFNDKRLNLLGGLQREYVKRVVRSIPSDRWNVIFEIENEPKAVIAHTGHGDVNLSARWSYQVAKWIKEERPKALVAFNAHGTPFVRRGLFLLDQGADRMIDIVSIHASYNAGTGDNWQLDKPEDFNNDILWRNAEKIHILDALNRTREDAWCQDYENMSRFYIIDSDGDYEEGGVYDNNADRVREIAGIASLFGAGYNNKYSSVDNYDNPVFNETQLQQFNDRINERFFDPSQNWMYGMYNTTPPYRRSYFENNAIRCMEMWYPIIRDKEEPYSIDFKIINNGTLDDLEADDYYLYDSTTGATVKITKTLNKVYPAWSWTIPISNLPPPHKEEVTMDFPASSCSWVVHELYLQKKISENEYERVGGDTLYTVVNLVED